MNVKFAPHFSWHIVKEEEGQPLTLTALQADRIAISQ